MKRLIEKIAQMQNPSVVGLDSLLDYIPQHIKDEKFEAYGDSFDAAAQGDAAGKAVVEEYTSALGESIVNAINTLQPEIICIGGGVSKQGENLLRPIRTYMDSYCFDRFAKNRTEIRIAQLGNDAGVIGAALIGLQQD